MRCVLLVVTPDSVFGVLVSAQALVVTLFGGAGTLWGPVIGAAILIPLSETLQAELGNVIPGIQGVVYGVAIILVIILAARRHLLARARPGSTSHEARLVRLSAAQPRRRVPSSPSPPSAEPPGTSCSR